MVKITTGKTKYSGKDINQVNLKRKGSIVKETQRKERDGQDRDG